VSRLLGKFFTPKNNACVVRLALAEGLYSGITTVNNWSHNLLDPEYADAEMRAHIAAGGRACFSYGYSRKTPKDSTLPLEDIADFQDRWFKGGTRTPDGLISLAIAPRGPENNPIETCATEWEFARARGIRVTSHMGTHPKRVDDRQGIQTLAKAGLLGPDLLLIHVTHHSDEDLRLLAETQTPVSLSPYTELRTGFGITPVGKFLEAGVPVSLSVDTTILCGNADMFAIMKAIENIENGRVEDEFAISSERVLQMATIDGARALGIDDQVGSLTPGKRADLILVRTTDVNMMPKTVPTRMLVQSAEPNNIETVMVDGRLLKRGGRLTTIDLDDLVKETAETIERARVEATAPGAGEGIQELI
jgi:cytosine/adenosine deaminase-related metal-dependent hydrolase